MVVCREPTLRCRSHSNHVVRQATSFSNSTFLSRDIDDLSHDIDDLSHDTCVCNQLINYLLTGYPFRTEKY